MPRFHMKNIKDTNYTVTHKLVTSFMTSIVRSTIFPLHCNLALMGYRSEDLLYMLPINLNTFSVEVKVYLPIFICGANRLLVV